MFSRAGKSILSASFLLFGLTVFTLSQMEIGRIYSIPQALFPLSLMVAVGFLLFFYLTLQSEEFEASIVSLTVITGLLLSFPLLFISGIFGYGTDTLYHLGHSRDILQSGHFFVSNKYPLSHILVAQISLILDIELRDAAMLQPLIYFGALLAGVGLLVSQFDTISAKIAMLVPFAFILSLGFDTGGYTYYKPYFSTVLFIPFGLAVLSRGVRLNSISWTILSFPILLAIAFLHPVVFIPILGMFAIYYAVSSSELNRLFNPLVNRPRRLSLALAVLVVSIIFSYWIIIKAQPAVALTFERALNLILSPGEFFANDYRGGAVSGGNAQSLLKSGVSRTEYLLRNYALVYGGALLALIMIGTWGLWSLFRLYHGDRYNLDLSRDGLILAWLIGSGALLAGNAVANILNVGITRPVPLLVVIFAIPLARIATYDYRARRLSVAALVICASVGLLLIFPSPVTYSSTPQATDQDISGMDWVISEKGSGEINGYTLDQHRFGSYLLGMRGLHERDDVVNSGAFLPTAFDTQLEEYGQTGELDLNGQVYIPISERDQWRVSRFYESQPHEQGLDRLSKDSDIAKIYANGEVDTYYIEDN